MLVRLTHVRIPVIVKAYICLLVSLSVKAVHLEIVSDLTTETFLAALRRFVSQRGYPTLIWSDNGTNFVGANNRLKELFHFVKTKTTEKAVNEFCASMNIEKAIHSRTITTLWRSLGGCSQNPFTTDSRGCRIDMRR